MKKSLLVKLLVLLVVIVLSYCVFWFFKAGQSEKIITKFFNEASAFASMEEIKVSGFPTRQKFFIKNLKLSLNSGIFKNNKILVSELELETGIFDNNYTIKPVGAVKLEDVDGSGKIYEVKFGSEPKIEMVIDKGIISNFSYASNGLEVVDETGAVLFSSSANNLILTALADDQGKLSISITGTVDEISQYGVADIYRNIFEKKIVDDIKNDLIKVEIPLGFNSSAFRNSFIENEVQKKLQNRLSPFGENIQTEALVVSGSVANQADNSAPKSPETQTGAVISKSNNSPQDPAKIPSNQQVQMPQPSSPASIANESKDTQNQVAANPANDAMQASLIANPELKSKITFDLIISLASNNAAPPAIGQPQDSIALGEQNLKINNISLSNSKFEIAVNGSLTKTPDDALPSGGLTVKVTNFQDALDNFENDFGSLISSAEKYVDIAKPKLELPNGTKDSQKSVETLPIQDNAKQPTTPQAQQPVVQPATGEVGKMVPQEDQSAQITYNMSDYYTQFFSQFAVKYRPIISEIGFKNSVSKDNVVQFDIRREKNLEFLVNDTPVRDIVGRF